MQGCARYCSGDLATAPVSLAVGTFSLTIPNNVAMLGGLLYDQGVVAAPGTNSFAAVTSNGLELRLGN